MKLTENECSEALTRLLRPYFAKVSVQDVYHSINKGHSIEEDSNSLTLLIQEYFDNPPLKFDELKEGMWVWDNKMVLYIRIAKIIGKTIYTEDFLYGFDCYGRYEKNRFYRKQVEE